MAEVSHGVQVVMARVDAKRRQAEGPDGMGALREAFAAAEGLMQSYFPGYLDPGLRITAYRADCELRLGKDIEAARSVWEAAMKTPASRYPHTPSIYPKHCSANEVLSDISGRSGMWRAVRPPSLKLQ